MSLNLLHKKLCWPSPEEIRNPVGEGASIFAALAQAKIGRAISLYPDASDVKVGVLLRNSKAVVTEAPLAVVAEFSGKASDKTLSVLHSLAWNFSHSPSVVTIEPGLLRVWTCCEPPEKDRPIHAFVVQELSVTDLAKSQPSDITKRAIQILHWINLVSGEFFRERAERFRRDQRADQMLLANLQYVRHVLHKGGLIDDDICHDLLARIVFVQFLFDRKDSNGKSALNQSKLANLHEEGILHKEHTNFASILEDYKETYRLFDWLNSKFNGDLFPGKGATPQERAAGWRKEREHVKEPHLRLLRDFIKGDLDMPKGQLCLWPQYSFDTIPLEFISSVYETFVRERASREGIYYTPPHLVDFILDRVLPWDSDEWNLKVLDPACGSGVFLVKAFQRLIHRWKKANPNQTIRAETLRGLLEKNLFGVDKDPHAVRVASFSLYLAMCDEIEPKHYWSQVTFPAMRERRLLNADFFEENRAGFRSEEDAVSYDLVIGNAPWGENLLTEAAKKWTKDKAHQWPVANKGLGTLFLPKAAALTKPSGKVAMIQAASSLLFNRSRPACEFRQKFFSTFRVEEVVNLSAIRFKVFNRKDSSTKPSVSPSCVVIFQPQPPDNKRFAYISPKQTEDMADEFAIVIDPHDCKMIYSGEAAVNQDIWSALMWGNHRDYALIRRLQQLPSLLSPQHLGPVFYREGVIFGDKEKYHHELEGRRILSGKDFPPGTGLYLDEDKLDKLEEPRAHSKDSTDFRAFELPQLIVKQGWRMSLGRFHAALARSSSGAGVICTQSYITVHAAEERANILKAACLSYNSILAVYFLLLTSGRFASYRPEPLVKELLRVPIPDSVSVSLDGAYDLKAIDDRVRDSFKFKDAEWVLVEDLFNVTLPDFKGDAKSPGRQRTRRRNGATDEPELRRYCDYFIRVMKAGFGQDKQITATIFRESDDKLLPYRLVAFELNRASKDQFHVETLDTPALLAELEALNRTWLRNQRGRGGSIYHERVARIHDQCDKTPTIFIIKPDAYRYWTRSMGLQDADEVAVDFARWQAAKRADSWNKE